MGGQGHAPSALAPGKEPVPTIKEAGWAPGPSWTGAENLAPHRDSKTGLQEIKSYRQQRLCWQVNTSLLYMCIVRVVPQSLWLEALLQLPCHKRAECAKSRARRSVCFCSHGGGGASVCGLVRARMTHR